MNIESKIVNGLERLSEALKALLWEKAKTYGISPIQIQILLFVAKHKREICNVSYLAKEFNVTKATISDAVRVLIKKEYLEKDYSPTDNRRYNLLVRITSYNVCYTKLLRTNFNFDAVTARMQVNTSDSELPMLGVYEVYGILSKDLSLPFQSQ